VGGGNGEGQRQFNGQSPPYGAEISYYLPAGEAAASVSAPGGAGDEAPAGRRRPPAPGHVAILDAKGDTVQTLPAPAGPGFHRVYWNLRLRPEKKPLSPSERRDSVLAAGRIAFLTDSLTRAGWNRQVLERASTMLLSGERGGFRFGGGGPVAGQFQERPAESPLPRARGAAGAPGAAAGAPGAAGARRRAGAPGEPPELGPENFQQVREFADLVRKALPPGSSIGGMGGFFGRQGPPLAAAGDYTVTLTVAGKTLTTKVRVERGPTAPAIAAEENTPDDDR